MAGTDGESAAPGKAVNPVRILATSDLHMNLTGFNYVADRDGKAGGLARVASLVAEQRKQAARRGIPLFLFDNGDALQGAPMDETALAQSGPHPLMRCLAHLRYDAIGLGNHDFDFGIDVLLRVLSEAPCPVICSNLTWLDRAPPPMIRPWALVQKDCAGGRVRIGVMSFLPPQTSIWNARNLRGRVGVRDILSSARDTLAALRRTGCDLVVALAHTGLGRVPARALDENAALAVAGLDGVDAVVAGHSHDHAARVDRSGTASPVVLPGSSGSHLGVIDVPMDRTGAARARAARAELIEAASSVPPDPGLVRLLSGEHAATRNHLRRPAGHGDYRLHSYFTFVAPDRGLALVAAAQAAALRPHLAGTAAEGLEVLSAVAPGRFGGRAGPEHYTDIPAGPLQLRHLADLCAFPNMLSAVVVTGRQLRDWLEKSASIFRTVLPGAKASPLLAPEVPGHDFDVIHGVSYEISLNAPARFRPDGSASAEGGRVRDLRLRGCPVEDARRFVVAVNSYRASGGGGFPHLPTAQRLRLPDIKIRSALLSYQTGDLPRDPLEQAPPPWRFAALSGASVDLPTGPGACAHLDELGDRLIGIEGTDAAGFLHLHLAL